MSTQWHLNCVESMCIGKSLERNIPNVNSDFLGKWELHYWWILLSLYIFALSKFLTGIVCILEEKTQVWKTNSIRGPKLFSWKVMFAFTSHPAYSPAGNLMYSRSSKCHHLQMTDTCVPSAGHSSKLQNWASMWLLDNSLWWLTRTMASTCCLSLLPTLQIFFSLVSVNSPTIPIFLLWVIR